MKQSSTFGDRVKAARERLGWEPEDLVAHSGVVERTIKRYEDRENPPTSGRSVPALKAVADSMGVTVEWLRTGEGEMRVQKISDDGNGAELETRDLFAYEAGEDVARLPLATVAANGGIGEEPFEKEVEGYVSYSSNQIRRELGVDPSRLVVMPISGNSMEPTLKAGDRVLVARYDGEPIMDGAIYVFRRHHMGVVIKRVFWGDEGTLHLRSDNREDPIDMSIAPADEEEWQVIGRVARVEKHL